MINRAIKGNTPISLETLKQVVPSAFNDEAYEKTSARYQHISTESVIKGLIGEGYLPVNASQSRTRIEGKESFTKHMLRFRHVDAQATVNGLFPELVLINSHDGSSSYKLMSGIYRLVCSNGMIAGRTYEEVKVRHQGDIVGRVIEGTYSIIENSNKMIEQASEMESVILSIPERKLFAEAAHELKFQDSEMGKAIEPVKFLEARRYQEYNKHDLFTVFNVIQENIIKGGVKGHTLDANGRRKNVTTRAVNGIDQNTYLNRCLWSLAEKMMELKR